jgi:hypothetical protein
VLVRTRRGAEVTVAPDDENRVVVRTELLARIAPGRQLRPGARPLVDEYVLRRDDAGQLRLAEVPEGVRLSQGDVAGSYSPRAVYFLRAGRPDAPRPRLVPDRVFVPVDGDAADVLVRRLLAGPSDALAGGRHHGRARGLRAAAPGQRRRRRPHRRLTAAAGAATAVERQHLSAQLVWTLRDAGVAFTSLRLLVEGRPVRVEGAGQVQDRDAWADYEPGRAVDGGAVLSVRDGRLAGLAGGAVRSEATDGRLPVVLGVASPAGGALALLVRPPEGPETVLTGPPRGPFTPRRHRPADRVAVVGVGRRGLWVVDAGESPGGPARRPGTAVPVEVSFTQARGSRAAHAAAGLARRCAGAAVFGPRGRAAGLRRQGRARPEGQAPGRLPAGGAGLTDVADVTWESGTSLVALGALSTATRLPVRLAVDGSVVEPVRTLGLDGEAETVTAAPGRPLVVGARLGGEPVLFVAEESGLFREPTRGSAPRYPG